MLEHTRQMKDVDWPRKNRPKTDKRMIANRSDRISLWVHRSHAICYVDQRRTKRQTLRNGQVMDWLACRTWLGIYQSYHRIWSNGVYSLDELKGQSSDSRPKNMMGQTTTTICRVHRCPVLAALHWNSLTTKVSFAGPLFLAHFWTTQSS